MIAYKAGDEDTICAIATAPGVGAISLIRVSGHQAVGIVSKLSEVIEKKSHRNELESHRSYLSLLKASSGAAVDQALITYFANGKSFTGEETIEIAVHGGEVLAPLVVQELIRAGARMAQPGEFTYRSFMNGKLDLVQAESVLALIESRSKAAAEIAIRDLKGLLSHEIATLEDGLVWLGAHIEASIDFSSEGIEVSSSEEILEKCRSLQATCGRLLDSYQTGKVLKDGLKLSLFGRPNSGKSSLLNAMVGYDRAIVSDVAGTTRDLVDADVRVSGVNIKLVDTAGVRDTLDPIEKMGVQRSIESFNTSDIGLVVIDLANKEWIEDLKDFRRVLRPKDLIVFNKIDLDTTGEWRAFAESALEKFELSGRSFFVSADKNKGINELLGSLPVVNGLEDSGAGVAVLTQLRHFEALQKVDGALRKVFDLVIRNASPEFLALELGVGIRAIHELLGKEFDEQVINRVFKEFCLGK